MASKLRRAAAVLGFGDPLQVPWGDLRFQHVAAIRSRLREEGLAPGTVNCLLHALKGVARAAFRLGLLSGEDLARIREVEPLRYARELAGRALTADEVKALIRVCVKDRRTQGRRDAALLSVLFATGMRRSEVVALALEDYDRETGALLLHGKGDRERKVYLAGQAKAAFDGWLDVRGESPGSVFVPITKGGSIDLRPVTDQWVYACLRRRARQAGVKRFSPHDLRRTFTTLMLERGADLLTVSRFVGHANVETTRRYDRRGEVAKRKLAQMVDTPSGEEAAHAGTPGA